MTFFLATTQQSRANATGEEWTKGAYILCNLLLGCSQLVFHYYEICLKVDFSRYFCVKVPQLQPKKNERFLVQCSSITNLVLKQIFLEKKTKPDNQCVLQNNISRTLIVIYESRDLPCSHVQVRHFFLFFCFCFLFFSSTHINITQTKITITSPTTDKEQPIQVMISNALLCSGGMLSS